MLVKSLDTNGNDPVVAVCGEAPVAAIVLLFFQAAHTGTVEGPALCAKNTLVLGFVSKEREFYFSHRTDNRDRFQAG